jgi:hypothetical protein
MLPWTIKLRKLVSFGPIFKKCFAAGSLHYKLTINWSKKFFLFGLNALNYKKLQ